MKRILLFAVMARWLVDILAPRSEGGVLIILAVLILIMLAVAIYDARSNTRDVLGWIVNIIAAIAGGSAALYFIGLALPPMLAYIHFPGLAASHHPLRYVVSAAIGILVVLGSWVPLLVINRWRDGDRSVGYVAKG